MTALFKTEWMKLEWKKVALLILCDVLVNMGLGVVYLHDLAEFFQPSWFTFYMHSISFHAMFFFPLYTGLFATFLCFYEHRNGGWKQLASLPCERQHIFYAKGIVLLCLTLITQTAFFIGYCITGLILSVPGEIPWRALFISILGGWFGIFPLMAAQLWISSKIKNFGAAMVMNISCVLPNLVLTGLHSSIGSWLPFTAPYYIMFPQGVNLSPAFDLAPYLVIISFTFAVYFFLGRRSFMKRDWLA